MADGGSLPTVTLSARAHCSTKPTFVQHHPEIPLMTTSRNFIVSGRVQGVGFRYRTKCMAEQLKLSGWARNLPSGEVEVSATGDSQKLAELEAWLWIGAAQAQVSAVAVAEPDSDSASERSGGFHIRV